MYIYMREATRTIKHERVGGGLAHRLSCISLPLLVGGVMQQQEDATMCHGHAYRDIAASQL